MCRVVVVLAHTDDCEVSCGGAVLRHRERGDAVALVVATDGRISSGGSAGAASGVVSQRRQEQLDSARRLGVDVVRFLDYPDGQFPCEPRSIEDIRGAVARGGGAERVYTHWPRDSHQDHRNVAMATIAACRAVPELLFVENPTTSDFTPEVYVSLDKAHLEAKLDALAMHRTQVSKWRKAGRTMVEYVRIMAQFRGQLYNHEYAEVFALGRLRGL